MTELPIEIALTRHETGEPARARIVELTEATALTKIESAWWTEFPIPAALKELEIDRNWEWDSIVRAVRWDWFTTCVAVETVDDGAIQGAMALAAPVKSLLEPGRFALHVGRLATAPRNRRWLSPPAGVSSYRGVGLSLINYAKGESYDLRLDGRLNLQVRVGGYAEGFYRRRGFKGTGAGHGDMMTLELPGGN